MSPLKARGRRTLLMLALVCAAPVVASYVAYYWFRPPGQVNYGELLEVKPAQEIVGTLPDDGKFRLSDYRGRWLFLTVDAGPARLFLAEHPGLIVARVDPAQWAALPGVAGPPGNIYLIDPLGNIVLRYPADPDIKRMAKDLERLLRASRIG